MALKDFTYEMVVPNEDLPCKFLFLKEKTAITAAPTTGTSL